MATSCELVLSLRNGVSVDNARLDKHVLSKDTPEMRTPLYTVYGPSYLQIELCTKLPLK